MAIGNEVRDTASLSGAATPVAGSVVYTLYNGTACANNAPTGSVVVAGSSQSVTGSSAPAFPNSAAFTVTTAGTYQWQAVFTSSNGQNSNATSPCGSETFTVGPNSPTLATTAQYSTDSGSTFNNVGANTVAIGNEVRDTASLSGAATPVAGSVVYTLYNGTACANNAPTGSVVVTGSSQSVTGSSAPAFPNSAAFTVTTAGTYQWQAVFTSSNGQNSNATSPCGSETFTVGPNSPTLATTAQYSTDGGSTFNNVGGHHGVDRQPGPGHRLAERGGHPGRGLTWSTRSTTGPPATGTPPRAAWSSPGAP